MRFRSKPVWLLIGVHTLCLTVGGWFLCQLIDSTTDHQAAVEGWERLCSRSRSLVPVVGSLQSTDLMPDSPGHEKLESAVRAMANPQSVGVILVSRGGNVVRNYSAPGESTGEKVNWQSDSVPPGLQSEQRGWVRLSSGRAVAIGYPVSDASAMLVVYDRDAPVPAWRAALLQSLPLVAGVAFLWTWILSSVATYLLSARLEFEESNRQAQMEHDAFRSAQDLLRTRDAVIFGLAKLAESRDPETGHHLERISLYSTRLANELRLLPKFRHTVTPGFVRLLGISSVLHDIGKVGLEDTVLLKPGRLNDDERKKMQEHTLVAGECLREIEQRLGASNFLQTAREIALHHHERWDGNGYPMGLSGEEIPLAARIVAVADVYDALSSRRVYKDAFPHVECVRVIREGAGTQFDPELVEVFLAIESDFAAIAQRFAGTPAADSAAPTSRGDMMTRDQESVLLDVVSGANTCESSRSSSVA